MRQAETDSVLQEAFSGYQIGLDQISMSYAEAAEIGFDLSGIMPGTAVNIQRMPDGSVSVTEIE